MIIRSWTAPALAILLAASVWSGPSALQQQQLAPRRPTDNPNDRPWPTPERLAERKQDAENRRLFRTDEPLKMTLSFDWKAVDRDRNPESETTCPGTAEIMGDDGKPLTIPMRVRTRGHSRRNTATCTFSPLRLEFDRPSTRGTDLAGHGALKLGTHCRRGSEEVVRREYLVYRMLNRLTPLSFRARPVLAKYIDTVSKNTIAEDMALLIEDDDDVARRLEGRITTQAQVIFPRVDQDALNLMMLFQYMIGNTDFSIMVQHNIRLVQTQDGRRYAVPYDFDYAGLVDAGYAVPGKDLPITSVRDRLYRGPCRTPAEWQPYFDKLKAEKASLLQLVQTAPGLSPQYRRSATNYLEDFYRKIDRPFDVKREIIDACQKIGM